MATFYTNENSQLGATPPSVPGNELYGGRDRVFRSTILLDAPKTSPTVNGTVVTTADTVVLARVPAGWRFVSGSITASVSLGASTIAIGIAGNTGKYRPAAVFTAVDTPTPIGTAAARAAAALGADEVIFLTVAVASLPNAATNILVIDLVFGGP